MCLLDFQRNSAVGKGAPMTPDEPHDSPMTVIRLSPFLEIRLWDRSSWHVELWRHSKNLLGYSDLKHWNSQESYAINPCIPDIPIREWSGIEEVIKQLWQTSAQVRSLFQKKAGFLERVINKQFYKKHTSAPSRVRIFDFRRWPGFCPKSQHKYNGIYKWISAPYIP